MSTSTHQLARRLERLRQRIAAAAERAGRDPQSVTLVAVTKYVGHEEARALVELGCRDLGESRPQELWNKAEALAGLEVRWHLIGRLQRNKVRRTLPLVALIHSVDSERLLAEVDREAALLGRPAAVLLEVDISGDSAKQGLKPAEAAELARRGAEFPHVEIRGLMGMAGLDSRTSRVAAEFASLARLRAELEASGMPLPHLSMGMSGDFETAIEQGATLVRVGSALWEDASEETT